MPKDIAQIFEDFRNAYQELVNDKQELQRELERVRAENRYLKNYIDDLELSPTKQVPNSRKRKLARGISQLLTQYSEEEDEDQAEEKQGSDNDNDNDMERLDPNRNVLNSDGYQAIVKSQSISPSKNQPIRSKESSPLGNDNIKILSSVNYLREQQISSPIKASQATTVILLSPTKTTALFGQMTTTTVPVVKSELLELSQIPHLSPRKLDSLRDEDVIEDSENEDESLIIPDDYTRLQRKQLKLEYLATKFRTDPSYTINLTINPITENAWIITDFKRNHFYRPKYLPHFKRAKHNIHSRDDKENMRQFYKALNGDDNDGENVDSDDEENELSQLADKWPSPPGFMRSEFPNTQEQIERQLIIDARIKDRLRRRLKLSLGQGMWLFTVDILNEYVAAKRFKAII